MKKLLSKISLLALFCLTTVALSAQTYNGGTWYSLYDAKEHSNVVVYTEFAEKSLFTPVESLTFDYKKYSMISINGKVEVYSKVDGSWQKKGEASYSDYKNYKTSSIIPLDANTTNIRYYLASGNGVYVKNHFAKLAKHILLADGSFGKTSESKSFGNVTIDGQSDAQTVTLRSFLTTGDITINLKKGLQTLDGEKALQLVRFRRYADGDVGRIQVQQLFMKALMDKVLSTESIVKNLGDYIKVAYKYVETDVSLSDAVKYANYITKVDTGKISMETLPGAGQYVGGVSYFVHDPVATREMVDRVFYSVAPEVNADGSIDSKSLLIEVANGGEVAGLAGRFTEKLAGEGFRLTDPTTYHGEQVDYTRIQVKTEGAGKELVKYFDKARVEKAPEDMGSADIRIVLGTNEK